MVGKRGGGGGGERLMLLVLLSVSPVADRLNQNPRNADTTGRGAESRPLHLAAHCLRKLSKESALEFWLVNQLLPRKYRTNENATSLAVGAIESPHRRIFEAVEQ